MIKPNPFTPQSGWEPRVFAGRKESISRFTKLMEEAAGGRSSHLIVLGEWGIGKTSLLKQFKKIAQEEGYLTSLCPISKFTEKDSPNEGISLIMQEILMGFPTVRGIKNLFEGVEEIGVKVAGFGGNIKRSKKTKFQPQIQFTKFLLEVWKHLRYNLAVVLLDDVQNLMPISQTIDILRLVLSREEIINKTKYLFILSSTPDGWASFIDKHDPIGRFFRKREVIKNLTDEETDKMIETSLKSTGVVFDSKVKDKVFESTRGHPYELQLLCSNLYDSQIEGKVTVDVWDSAFRATLKELGRDYFDSLFRRASERERDVLDLLAEKRTQMSIGDIRSIMIVERRAKNFPIANIKNFLYRLEQKGLLKRTQEGNFEILDPMFAEYVVAQGTEGR